MKEKPVNVIDCGKSVLAESTLEKSNTRADQTLQNNNLVFDKQDIVKQNRDSSAILLSYTGGFRW